MQTGAPRFPATDQEPASHAAQIAPDAEIVSDGLMRYSYRDFEACEGASPPDLPRRGRAGAGWSLSWTGTRTAISRHFLQCR